MSLSCEKEKSLTSDRLAKEESFLEKVKGGFKTVNITEDTISPEEFHDPVNHPPHYNNSPAACECGRRIECIDVTRHYSFNIGNAIKYLWRCDLKGRAVEDLKKAIWYIEDEIAKREKSA